MSGGISYQPNATDSIYEDDVYADNDDDDEEEEEEEDRCASNGDDDNRLAWHGSISWQPNDSIFDDDEGDPPHTSNPTIANSATAI